MSNLSKQLKFFHDNKDDLLRKYGEKFIVVSPGLKVMHIYSAVKNMVLETSF